MQDLNLNRSERTKAIARLQSLPDFKVLTDFMSTQMEAHRNELENPKNPTIQFTQGQVATYRDIFNYLHEKYKDSTTQV